MEVIVMKVIGEKGSAMVTRVIGAGISPFTGDGLDEAFGLAIGLGAIGFGEEMFEAELLAGSGEEFGAVGGALVGEDGADGDPVSLVKGDGLVEGGQDAGSFLVWKQTGNGQAGMIIS